MLDVSKGKARCKLLVTSLYLVTQILGALSLAFLHSQKPIHTSSVNTSELSIMPS